MLTFQKQDRLLTPREFKRVYDCRCSVSNQEMIVYGARNDLGRTRLGLSVSRKFGNAVARNRFKRLVREAFRLCRADFPLALDLIVVPRAARKMSLAPVQETLRGLANALARRLARQEKA